MLFPVAILMYGPISLLYKPTTSLIYFTPYLVPGEQGPLPQLVHDFSGQLHYEAECHGRDGACYLVSLYCVSKKTVMGVS